MEAGTVLERCTYIICWCEPTAVCRPQYAEQDGVLKAETCKLKDHTMGELPMLATSQTYCPGVTEENLTDVRITPVHDCVNTQTAPITLDKITLDPFEGFQFLCSESHFG